MRAVLKGNYAAPIGQPTAVLDVGCGTGRWAMEMAAQFPGANVIGLDVVTPEADEAATLGHGLDRRPSNYVFVQGNVLDGLPFSDATFAFVHQRLLVAAIPADRWQSVVNELLRVTRHGGWVELVEAIPAQGGPAMNALHDWLVNVSLLRGVDTRITQQIGTFLQNAGAQNITFRDLTVPLGRADDRVSAMMTTIYFSLSIRACGKSSLLRESRARKTTIQLCGKHKLKSPRGSMCGRTTSPTDSVPDVCLGLMLWLSKPHIPRRLGE